MTIVLITVFLKAFGLSVGMKILDSFSASDFFDTIK